MKLQPVGAKKLTKSALPKKAAMVSFLMSHFPTQNHGVGYLLKHNDAGFSERCNLILLK